MHTLFHFRKSCSKMLFGSDKFLDKVKLHYPLTLQKSHIARTWLLFLQILGQAPSLGSFEVPSAGGATAQHPLGGSSCNFLGGHLTI